MWHLAAAAALLLATVFCSISGPTSIIKTKCQIRCSRSLSFFFYILWDLVSSGMFSHKNDRMGHSVTGTNHYFFYIEYILFCRCSRWMLPKADYKSVRPLVIPLLNSVVSEWMYSESLYLHNKQKWLFFSLAITTWCLRRVLDDYSMTFKYNKRPLIPD